MLYDSLGFLTLEQLQDSFLGPTPSHNHNLLTPAHMSLPGLRQTASSITHWMGTDVWNYTSVQYHLIVLGPKYEISLQICPEETGMPCERRR